MRKRSKSRPMATDKKLLMKWTNHILTEKECDASVAQWKAKCLAELADFLPYGYAIVAYYQQTGEFKFIKATLLHYEHTFGKTFKKSNITSTLPLWNIDENRWVTLRIENLLDWRPVV